jgi:hypothetical protein
MVHFSNFGLWMSVGYNYPQVVWCAGSLAIFDQRPDALAHFLDRELHCGYLSPVQTQRLAAAAGKSAGAPRDFEIRITAGAASHDVVEALQAKVARHVVSNSASSECQMMLKSPHRAPEDIHWWAPEPDRVAEVVDENRRRCADGAEGELRIRLLDCDCSSRAASLARQAGTGRRKISDLRARAIRALQRVSAHARRIAEDRQTGAAPYGLRPEEARRIDRRSRVTVNGQAPAAPIPACIIPSSFQCPLSSATR